MTDHCWHETGLVLMSDPPQTEEVCCYCGKKRTRQEWTSFLKTTPEGHGPHLRPAMQVSPLAKMHLYTPTYSGPCERTS